MLVRICVETRACKGRPGVAGQIANNRKAKKTVAARETTKKTLSVGAKPKSRLNGRVTSPSNGFRVWYRRLIPVGQ